MRGPVAIVHDWLTSMRGAERVVEVLCQIYPRADVFTLRWEPRRLSAALAGRRVTTSFIDRMAQKYMQVSELNAKHASHLPTSADMLAILARVSDDRLADEVTAGRVHPGLRRPRP